MSKTISAGIAMFAMLFGAGNVVFPLALGRDVGDMVAYAIVGFCLSAVLVPLIGLVSVMLYNGDYKAFLNRVGPIPAMLVAFICMLLMGPTGGIARCIATSYNASKYYFPDFSLAAFSILAALIIFLFSVREGNVIELVGKFLGPLKIVLLLSIIIVGVFWVKGAPAPEDISTSGALLKGVTEGYGTMDLIGTLFFTGLIVSSLRRKGSDPANPNYKELAVDGVKAGVIAGLLLAVVYTGFCLVASFHGPSVAHIDKYELLNALAPFILGPHGGALTNVTVALSCLVTAIALTTVFAQYLHQVILRKHVSYASALAMTVMASALMTNLGFRGIMAFIAPIAEICYPALIVLAIVNIAHKLFGFKWVKAPVLATFVLTLLGHWS